MDQHTFTLPAQQVSALDELKDQIVHRRPQLPARSWALLGLGLAVAAVLATFTWVRR